MSEELDPKEWLQRVQQLKEQRDEQDAERVKKLEEELIQGRSERLARRAERARSLSPDKPSTPQPLRSAAGTPRSIQDKAADTPTPVMEPPAQQAAREDSLQRLTDSPAQVLEDVEPKKPTPSAAALGRSGTLSWQRRPQSGSIRRPLSTAASSADEAAMRSPREHTEPSSPGSQSSRQQIAQSLGAKDPSWFRQTPDRGAGSAAYRRNQEDSLSETDSVSVPRRLPGMSRESTAEPEAASPPPESVRSSSSVRGSAAWSNRFSSNTSLSGGDTEWAARAKSPLPVLESQKFAPPSGQGPSNDGIDHVASTRGLAMSPTQGRISPERPVSPTKGMGGFVQSAMLKRSDSVNKRWSAQAPQGLSRQNSTLSNRGSTYGPPTKSESKPPTLSRDNAIEASSRPGSSSSNITITKDASATDNTPKGEIAKPALPHHDRSKPTASTFSEDNRPQDETSPPSPSKRWSPTKSSWLESALKKPESPKPTPRPPPQPAWMSEISRIKQKRGSVDLSRGTLQSPPAETTASGRSSPIKDLQLRPGAARKSEAPQQDEVVVVPKPPKLVKPIQSPEAKTNLLSKPSGAIPGDEQSEKGNVTEFDKPLKPVESLPLPKAELNSLLKPSVATESHVAPSEDISTLGKDSGIPQEASAPLEPKSKLSAACVTKGSQNPPSAAKSKPTTPPKRDFRANLKPRQNLSAAPESQEVSEFQSVFGKLKRVETKNYVAPDTLKDNILRGKQALNVTHGPKPTVRRDEFKESLITQKAAMLAKAQETGSAAHRKTDSSPQYSTMPEALSMRNNLGRPDDGSRLPPAVKEKGSGPEAISCKTSLPVSEPEMLVKPRQSPPAFTTKETPKSSKIAERFNPTLAGLLARGPSPMASSHAAPNEITSEASTRLVQENPPGPGPGLTHMTRDRARGPKRRAPGSKQAGAKTDKGSQETVLEKVTSAVAVPLVKAEHVSPSFEPSRTNMSLEEPSIMRTPATQLPKEKPVTPAKSPSLTRKFDKASSPELPRKPASLELNRRVLTESSMTPSKSPLAKPTKAHQSPSPPPNEASPYQSSRALPASPPTQKSQSLKNMPPPIPKDILENREPSSRMSSSVKSETTMRGRQLTSSPPASEKAKASLQLPNQADDEASLEHAGSLKQNEQPAAPHLKPQARKSKSVGLGLGSLENLGVPIPTRSRESIPLSVHSEKAFPISASSSDDRRQSEPFRVAPVPEKPWGIFSDIFDEAPVTSGELPENINTIHILKNPPIDLGPSGKIKTLRKQIYEVNGDGKLSPLPIQEEHILFQNNMYLCTHVFCDSNGARATEVYLWSGDGVPEPTIDDVQLFARNYAKQNQGKLIAMRQGKESPRLFEALGGIVITRRGSRPSSKEYMLCGRQHLGHIAFDEVDFSLKSLCSGYAYIASTETGKVYLWKGRGCSAEELSGARLMGMDLAPTGDFTEVDEGSEPADMFAIFPPHEGQGPAIPRSADHWRYKATADQYRTRLFKIVQQQPSGWGRSLQVSSFFAPLLRRPSWQSSTGETPTERIQTPSTPKSPLPPGITTKIVEIMPFCQRDVEPEYIYVLDAFFEMYIIVGPLSRTQAHAFSTALEFAQEYGILAVSEEDRPFMPVTTIVLEGVPRDMKAVFRFWDDAMIPAAGLMRGKLGRGKSLRIVGLEKAIEATRR